MGAQWLARARQVAATAQSSERGIAVTRGLPSLPAPAMELKVWVEGIQRIVCGVTDKTTCQVRLGTCDEGASGA